MYSNMSNIYTVNNIINYRNRDCIECRLLSGSSLVAAGLYVYHHSKQYHNQIGKATMYSIASVLAFLGTTRILDLPPFRNKLKNN